MLSLKLTSIATAVRNGASLLRISPPTLTTPKTYIVTNAEMATKTEISLFTNGSSPTGVLSDWIVQLPAETLISELAIHGRDEARNIVIMGGRIEPKKWLNETTMRLVSSASTWGVSCRRGFSGATGGTFKFKIAEGSYIAGFAVPETAPIPWDATAAQVKAALEAAAGVGSVFAVDGPDTPGGPWLIVPTYGDRRLGRPVQNIAGLTGSPVAVSPLSNTFGPPAGSSGMQGITLKQFRGTAHVEGVRIGGNYCGDAFRCQSNHATSVLQIVNCHFDPLFHEFHNDFYHPDGAQFYLGPAKAYLERTDFISMGGNGLITQPKATGAVGALYDYWAKDCIFEAKVRADVSYSDPNQTAFANSDASTALYFSEGVTPTLANMGGAPFQLIAEGCYATRRNVDGSYRLSDDDAKYVSFGYSPIPPQVGWQSPNSFSGVTERAAPSKYFAVDTAGLGYTSPGYTGDALPAVTQRQ